MSFASEFDHDRELFLHIAEHHWDDFMFADHSLLQDEVFLRQAVKRNGRILSESKGGMNRNFELALIAFATTEDLVDHYSWSNCQGPEFSFIVKVANQIRCELRNHAGFVEFLKGVSFGGSSSGNTVATVTKQPALVSDGNSRRSGSKSCRLAGIGAGGDATVGKKKMPGFDESSSDGVVSNKFGGLQSLQQGKETTFAYTKLIADFVGIPTGERVGLLRQASANLARWGF